MFKEKRFTLAIETAVDGGSISVLEGHTEVDCWVGSRQISKAEEVLENIGILLENNYLTKSEIKIIAVSNEAGSSTGLKIGLATAKGLAKGLNSVLASVSLGESLEAFVSVIESGKESAETIIAMPFGKQNISCRYCSSLALESQNAVMSKASFTDFLQTNQRIKVYAHENIIDEMPNEMRERLINLGKNMAKYIGLNTRV